MFFQLYKVYSERDDREGEKNYLKIEITNSPEIHGNADNLPVPSPTTTHLIGRPDI